MVGSLFHVPLTTCLTWPRRGSIPGWRFPDYQRVAASLCSHEQNGYQFWIEARVIPASHSDQETRDECQIHKTDSSSL